jgi:outer membrane autotransporter protein
MEYLIDGGASQTLIGSGGGTLPASTVLSDGLLIGVFSTGTLDISDAGELESEFTSIGFFSGSSGVLTATDRSKLTFETDFVIGEEGTGVFIAESGARIGTDATVLGYGSEAVGSGYVIGDDTTLYSYGSLQVGYFGTGNLAIAGGGTVRTSGSTEIGSQQDSLGIVTVVGSGSSLRGQGDISIGRGGVGVLTVADGALVSSGDANVLVGQDGDGTLAVLNGGTVTSAFGVLAVGEDSQGEATVAGPGSTWTNRLDLVVGYAGFATLYLEDGGAITSEDTHIGSTDGSFGLAILDGDGSVLSTTADLNVGRDGEGYLGVLGGARIEVGQNLIIANGETALGTMNLFDEGTRVTVGGEVIVGQGSQGTLTLSGGTMTVGGGSGTLTLGRTARGEGTLNIGAAADDTPEAPPILEAGTITVGEGDGLVVFNHTGTNANPFTLSADITGATEIEVLAGYTILSGTIDNTGGTTLYGGTLAINGSIGDVTVIGGTLGGSGTIGSLIFTRPAVVAPGNSIGTLTVSNNLSLPSGSTYEVEVDSAGNSDKLVVGGTLTLARDVTLAVMPETVGETGDTYDGSTTYTIVSAGAISGRFDRVTDSFAFLDPFVTYADDAITLTLVRNDAPFVSVARTPNQVAVASAVEPLGTGSSVYRAVAALSDDAAREAFDDLSGEIHASAKTMALDDSRLVRDMALARVRTLRDQGPAEGPDVQVWAHAYGAWSQWGGDDENAATTRSLGGFFAGGDMAVTPDWRLGVMTGYGRASLSVTDRESDLTADVAHMGIQGGGPLGTLEARFGAAYSLAFVHSDRSVAFGSFSDDLSADYLLGTAQVFGELAQPLVLNAEGTTRLEPFVRLASVTTHNGAFEESGGEAALKGAATAQTVTFGQIGMAADTAFTLWDRPVTARGKLAWRRALGGLQGQSDLAFAGGDDTTINGAPLSRDAVVLETGLAMALSDQSALSLDYNGLVGKGGQGHALKLSIAATF